ncbi:MAG: hypothetical protein RIR70_2130, partial [Pseudomonadota bacterium]
PEYLSRRVEMVQDVASISELIEPLSSIARVPVLVRDDALLAAARGASLYSITPSVASAPAAGATPALGATPSPSVSVGASAAGGGAASSAPVSFRFSGALSGLLDLVAGRFGISWRHTPAGTIEFYHRDTRTFTVMVLPGDMVANTDIGTSGGGSSSGTAGSSRSATQRTQASVGMTFWKSLEDSINAVKSRDGVVTVNSSAGTVTVTDTPTILEQVGRLIEGQNALLSKQVLLDVKVVTLKLSNGESLGIDWGLVYTKLSAGGNKLGFVTNNGVQVGDGAGAALIFSTATNSFDSSQQSILKALAEQADISDVTSAQQYALNNQPTPIQVGTTSRFIDTYTRTVDTTTQVPTVSVTAGTVTSGVALQLLPRILDKENILIHLSADLSETPENLPPKTYGEAGSSVAISLWKQNVRNFMQRVSLKSGETLVLSGYENTANQASRSGVDRPDNLLLGGTRLAKAERTVIVIMITPVIMDRVRS